LIATAIGIAVAVPAVLAFNFFQRRNRAVGADLDDLRRTSSRCPKPPLSATPAALQRQRPRPMTTRRPSRRRQTSISERQC